MRRPNSRHVAVAAITLAAAVVGALLWPTQDPALTPIEPDPALPNVLIIGDSISIGYTVPVRDLLAGQANVHRIPMNGGSTRKGLVQLEAWLEDTDWDVVHFNWGLHDLKYIDDEGRLTDPATGCQLVAPSEYEANLCSLTERLQQTGATLIWCSTTPIPTGATGFIPGDETMYNGIAARVMRSHEIRTNDLNSYARTFDGIQLPADVHFTPRGSQLLGEAVASHIREVLPRSDDDQNLPQSIESASFAFGFSAERQDL